MDIEGAVYQGPVELLEAAQKEGFIRLEKETDIAIFLQQKIFDKNMPKILPICILNLDGWVSFLKDINLRTKNSAEHEFTEELLLVFENIEKTYDSHNVYPNDPICNFAKLEYGNTKEEIKTNITDEAIDKLKKIKTIDELLDPRFGFF